MTPMETKPLSCRISPVMLNALDKWISQSGWTLSRSAAAVYLVQSFFTLENGKFWNEIDVIELREPLSMSIQLFVTQSTFDLIHTFADEHAVSVAHAVRVILYDRLYHHGGEAV